MTVGERIKQARKLKGLTQKQLGELSETSEITVRQYELGKRQPRLEQLRRIASALDVEWTDLVPLEQQEQTVIDNIKSNLAGLRGAKYRIAVALEKLNDEGQQLVVAYADSLTEDLQYRRQPEETNESADDQEENR